MAILQCTVQRSSYYEVYFEYSYTQDKANAKTNLTHSLKLKQLTNGMDFDTVASVTVSYKVAGATFSKTGRINIDDKGDKGYTITLASGTSSIAHNTSTGVGGFTVSVDIPTALESGGYGPGKVTLTERTVSLPTIYRASVPTVGTVSGGLLSSIKMGDTVYIYTNRKSSSFTHTLQYDFASVKGVTISTGVGESYAWKVPDLAQYCNNAKSGKATITCTTYNGSTKVGVETCEVTINVPDATTPVFTNGDVIIRYGNPIATSAKSTNFTHLITYEFNGATGKVNNDPMKGGIVWWTPAELAGRITSASGEGTITCITYNGAVEVGRRTVPFKAVVPNEAFFQPKVTEFNISPTGGLPSVFDGLYVQGKTGVKARFTASSDYSEIDSYKITVDGRNFTGNPATSDLFTRNGSFTVTGIVTDKRGFSTTVTQDVMVYVYSVPSIEPSSGHASIVCERSTQDKTYDDAGIYLHVKGKRRYSPLLVDAKDINFCSVKYQYKVQGGAWSAEAVLMPEMPTNTDNFDVALPNVVTLTDKSYSIRLIVTDTIGSSDTYEFAIPTADVTLHLGNGGYGVAVGKYSEATPDNKMFEVAEDWDFQMKGKSVDDFVVEQGTSGNWEYRKWYSGNVEAWCFATDVNGAYADSLEVPSETYLYFPFDIYSAQPHLTLTGNHWEVKKYYANTVTDKSMKIVCYTEGNLLLTDISCAVHINGRWK